MDICVSVSKTILYILFLVLCCGSDNDFCYLDSCGIHKEPQVRYLLYDVNPPEGFNLRRDVYMRFAILAHKLKKSKDERLRGFKLVLPPWSRLVHWKYSEAPEHVPWSLYFDLSSLQTFVPVIEMYQFFEELVSKYSSKVVVDEVYVLQHFEDMFKTGNFKDRIKIEKCQKDYRINYFHYKNLTSNNVKCLSYHGPATKLVQLLKNSTAQTILLHHAEVALHEMFGNVLYWQARRSMRFSKDLKKIADDFRKTFLNSSDELDGTLLPLDWRDEKVNIKTNKGGPYFAVHLRRRDFLRGRSDEVPSITSAAKQIAQKLLQLHLSTVFVATDATDREYKELEQRLSPTYKVYQYIPTSEIKNKYKDGGVAIIDQIICSHAKYFMGTHESTFSFRIQEEREIMGFETETTFNCLCKDDKECLKPSVWKIVY